MLGAALLALFGGAYYYNATGFWAAAKNPPEFIPGNLTAMWQSPEQKGPTFATQLSVKLDDGQTIHLKAASKSIFNCSIGSKVEVVKYTNDAGMRFYRLGQRACINRSSKAAGSKTSNEQ